MRWEFKVNNPYESRRAEGMKKINRNFNIEFEI